MWRKGVSSKYHRNSHLKPFSCEERTAFKHLNKIWNQTKVERDALIKGQVYIHHRSDNCQEYHSFATQCQNTPGVMHTGIGFNIVQAKEYEKPPGTVMRDPDGNEWIVASSSLSNYWHCNMVLLRETFDGKEFSTSQKEITFPTVGWNIVNLPNEPHNPPLSYIDQQIRPSMPMTIPRQLDNVSIVMGRWKFRCVNAHQVLSVA